MAKKGNKKTTKKKNSKNKNLNKSNLKAKEISINKETKKSNTKVAVKSKTKKVSLKDKLLKKIDKEKKKILKNVKKKKQEIKKKQLASFKLKIKKQEEKARRKEELKIASNKKKKETNLNQKNAKSSKNIKNISVEQTKQQETALENKNVKHFKIDYKLLFTLVCLLLLLVFLIFLFTRNKNDELSFNEVNINEYLDLYKNEDLEYMFITQDNCTYCELLKPYVKRLETDYKIKFNLINISKLDANEMKKLVKSNIVFEDGWTSPIIFSIKAGKEVLNVKGYKEYSVLKKFVENSINPTDNNSFVKISIDKYIALLNSKDPIIIYIGRPKSSGCEVYTPILETVSVERNIKVYYLNTDSLDTNDDWDKLNNSNEIFKDTWFTPTTLIIRDGEVIDYKMESMDEESLRYFLDKNGV